MLTLSETKEEKQRRLNREKSKRWRDLHPEAHRATKKKWEQANPGVRTAIHRKWCEANPDAARVIDQRSHLKRHYGITPEDKAAMLAAQGGVCAICRTDEPAGKGWHVDHDHITQEVRSILCHHCNVGIGHFKENPELLLAAIAYLRTFQNGGQEEAA